MNIHTYIHTHTPLHCICHNLLRWILITVSNHAQYTHSLFTVRMLVHTHTHTHTHTHAQTHIHTHTRTHTHTHTHTRTHTQTRARAHTHTHTHIHIHTYIHPYIHVFHSSVSWNPIMAHYASVCSDSGFVHCFDTRINTEKQTIVIEVCICMYAHVYVCV